MSELSSLISLFYPSLETLGQFAAVESSDLPEEYQSLLDHHDHMTVTLEAWHNSMVDIRVLQEYCEREIYARTILLACQRDGTVVQFGIMRIDLAELPEIVRLEIQSQALPLGRIMIRHHLLREVELLQLWRIQPNEELRRHLNVDAQTQIYGRSARIMVEGKRAVELLEIVKAG